MSKPTAEYSGTIYHIDADTATLIINHETFKFSPLLMHNVTQHFIVGDRVKVEYRANGSEAHMVKCVVMERSVKA